MLSVSDWILGSLGLGSSTSLLGCWGLMSPYKQCFLTKVYLLGEPSWKGLNPQSEPDWLWGCLSSKEAFLESSGGDRTIFRDQKCFSLVSVKQVIWRIGTLWGQETNDLWRVKLAQGRGRQEYLYGAFREERNGVQALLLEMYSYWNLSVYPVQLMQCPVTAWGAETKSCWR